MEKGGRHGKRGKGERGKDLVGEKMSGKREGDAEKREMRERGKWK